MAIQVSGLRNVYESVGSPLWFFWEYATPWLVRDVVRILKLDSIERAEAKTYIFIVFYILVVLMLLLQVADSVLISGSWPFFLALVPTITGAFQQFVLLMRMGFSEKV
jgi:hypothetical protein